MDKDDVTRVQIRGYKGLDNDGQISAGVTEKTNPNNQPADIENETNEVSRQDRVTITNSTSEKSLSPQRQLLSMWYTAVVVITLLVLLPLVLVVNTKPAKCAYVIFVMAVLWVTEALPISITSILPVVMLPLVGVMPADQVSATYFSDASLLLFGGLAVTIAIEEQNLHKRIALFVLNIMGAEPRWLLLGVMLVTWLLSMWMSNTATTAMMIPIVQAVLQQLQLTLQYTGATKVTTEDGVKAKVTQDPEEAGVTNNGTRGSRDSQRGQVQLELRELPSGGHGQQAGADGAEGKDGQGDNSKRKQLSLVRLGKAMNLSIAMSANIGGTATLIGTGTNVVFLGQAKTFYQHYGSDNPVNFTGWMVLSLPLSALLLLIAWIWFQILFFRCDGGCSCVFSKSDSQRTNDSRKRTKAMLKEEYRKLGSITYSECLVAILFFLLVLLWISRDLGDAGGWGNLFQKDYVSDSTPAVLVAVLMFLLPSGLPDIVLPCKRAAQLPRQPLQPILSWKVLQQKTPWSLFLLIGGGFALAKASQTSGLSLWIGDKLRVLNDLNPWLTLLIICYIVVAATQIMSNIALCTLLMPIVAQMAVSMRMSPMFLMIPVTICSSLAFMLPVATAPNAIVFASGTVKVIDMVLSGFMVSFVSVPVLVFATYTWGNAYFNFETLPQQFQQNVTGVGAVQNMSAI